MRFKTRQVAYRIMRRPTIAILAVAGLSILFYFLWWSSIPELGRPGCTCNEELAPVSPATNFDQVLAIVANHTYTSADSVRLVSIDAASDTDYEAQACMLEKPVGSILYFIESPDTNYKKYVDSSGTIYRANCRY